MVTEHLTLIILSVVCYPLAVYSCFFVLFPVPFFGRFFFPFLLKLFLTSHNVFLLSWPSDALLFR